MAQKPENESLTNLPISTSYAEFAKRAVPEERRQELHLGDAVTYGEAVAEVLYNLALEGSVAAAREIREAIEGRTNQRRNAVGSDKFDVVVTWEDLPISKMLPPGSSDSTTQ